jgi:hypothetical protein
MNTTENTTTRTQLTSNLSPSEREEEKGIYTMPPTAKVWVYQSNKALSDTEVKAIEAAGIKFITQWAAHGASLDASFDVLYNRFIVLAVNEQQANASGCSIDSSVRFIKGLEQQFNLNLFDRMQVAYHDDNAINACHFNDLYAQLTALGKDKTQIANTIVFNNMITTKQEFDSKWEVPL